MSSARREIDHTGDLGIEVEAESLAALFEEAATGMFALLTDLETVGTDVRFQLSLSGEDAGDLMIRWLSELNYLHLTERVIFARFEVGEISDVHVDAAAFGSRIEPNLHTIYTEIKAVTYHDMVVESRNDDRWYARIIFDV